MAVDLNRVRPGDTVTVTGRVVLTHIQVKAPAPKTIIVDFGAGEVDIAAESVVEHSVPPEALTLGQMVTFGDAEYELAAPARARSNGEIEIVIWNSERGYLEVQPHEVERV